MLKSASDKYETSRRQKKNSQKKTYMVQHTVENAMVTVHPKQQTLDGPI